ncbi:hypothetical protein KP803_15225 [Vibrio sp. ZSDE26]|uniref:Uncharacterized protein n=1 Tax=Vibrio amylolyticus TaxID=2847292 RepID=A0A9X1XKY9_9VIBR|nr:hypothetical protein [Vibrio amylolyticus]MCK6264631.1 hypothetical protein [Vibrio amylolyticus]
MEKYCPNCHTELISRADVHVCPRHAIGDCTYDAYQLNLNTHAEAPHIEGHRSSETAVN